MHKQRSAISGQRSAKALFCAFCFVLCAFSVSADSGDFLLVRRPLDVQRIKLVAVNDQSLVHLKDTQGFVTLQLKPERNSPAEAAAFIAREAQKWADVIRKAGVKPH